MINIRKLEAELWESADLLRAGSKLTSNQYCMPVLGLIFLRYAYASELNRLMKYVDRKEITGQVRKEYDAIVAIYAELQKKRKHINTTDLMVEINAIISTCQPS